MTVVSRTFVLASAQEATRVKLACIRAARRGGGVVSITAADGERVEVLITPGLPVYFDTVALHPDADCDDEQPSFEWEYSGAL